MRPVIHGITVSVDVGDKEYGKGTNSFTNIQAKYPEPGQPIEEIDDVIVDGLDLYFAAWRTILAGRFVSGQITTEVDGRKRADSDSFKAALAATAARVEKVRNYLKKLAAAEDDGQQQ